MRFCRLVEHARLPVLILARGAVDEAVAEHVVVDTPVPPHVVGSRTGEPLHAVVGGWALFTSADQNKWET